MKFFLLAWLLSLPLSNMVANAVHLIKTRPDGKEFWGGNYSVTEGGELTIPCDSQQIPSDGVVVAFFWNIQERQIGTRTFLETALITKTGPNAKPYTLKPLGVKPRLLPNTRTLNIKNITRYFNGTYLCLVISMFGKAKPKKYIEATYFGVEVKAPARIDSTMKTPISLSAGEKLELDCTSSGNPPPNVRWRRINGPELNEDRTILHNKGLLSVHDVGQEDQGKYQCIASNSLGNDSRTFAVNVRVRARIITKEISYATIGKDGKVKCEAVGNPPPTFFWSWYEGHSEISLNEVETWERFSVETEHNFESSICYLKIKSVKRSDFRDYSCNAKNFDNYIPSSIQLRRYSVPRRPTIQTVAPKGNEISIGWTYGNDGGKKVNSVIIEYATINASRWESVSIENPQVQHFTIKNLRPQTKYKFRVYTVNELGESGPSVELRGSTQLGIQTETVNKADNPEAKSEKNVNMTDMWIGGVTGAFIIIGVAIVVVCVLMRNIQRNNSKKAAENAEHATQNANQDATTALINFLQHGKDRLSGTLTSGGTLTNSGDVLQLTTSNKWEFPRERLVLQNILGSGAFGIVMKAEADGINGFNSGTIPVAVKFVKENESASAKKDLVAELELLKLIEPHTNVINLLGCCTRSEPFMVIVEYCAYGDLQSFLRSSRGIRDPYYIDCYKRPSTRLTSKELLMFGTQIARGMTHLASLKVIHRDLAARNILVDENKVCKVSDFGFARDIYVEDHYTRKTAGGRFPIKWMAIESLLDGISTTKSDVWSFAIVLWEIITLGASPYPGMNSQEVVSFLQNGMRMDKPKHCSDDLYTLLLDCWQLSSHSRPNFEMLARYLERMYNDDFEYINMRSYDDHLYINFDGNTISGGSNSTVILKQADSTTESQQSCKSETDSLVRE